MVTVGPVGTSTVHGEERFIRPAIEPLAMRVSICIPCFNSSARLPETLRHLQKQRTPEGLNWEVIVIDNNSTDDTAAVAVRTWADCNVAPLRLIREARAGLSNARECGLRESQSEIVAFVDDDNWVCDSWVALVDEIMTDHPEVAVCGGCGAPVFESQTGPEWFSRFQLYYATGAQVADAGYVPLSRGALYGAGMSVRKSAWRAATPCTGLHLLFRIARGRNLPLAEIRSCAMRCSWQAGSFGTTHASPFNTLSKHGVWIGLTCFE